MLLTRSSSGVASERSSDASASAIDLARNPRTGKYTVEMALIHEAACQGDMCQFEFAGDEQMLGTFDAPLHQCKIPLGPNWRFRLNRQRGFQLGHSSNKFTVVAASDAPQS
jgi:hypothetical protein